MRISLNKRSKPIEEPITPTFSDEVLEKVFGPIEVIEHPLPEHLEGVLPAEERLEVEPHKYSNEDRFQSKYTELQFELVERTEEYKEDKGYKWKVKILDSGDTRLRTNSIVETWEQTLSEDFKVLEQGENEDAPTRQRRGRPRSDEVPAAPSLPTYEFPVVSAGKPWSHWPDPITEVGQLQDFRVSAYQGNQLKLLNTNEDILGDVTSTVLRDLGRRTGFPPEFVEKLSCKVAAEVINECISKYTGPEVAWVIESD